MRLLAHVVAPELRLNRQCITCTAPDEDPDTVAFSEHWKVVLHPDQTVPGACLLGSLRHVPKLADLTTVEAAEFFVVYGRLEIALERALGADLVNLWCLRNFAFRHDDPDPPLLDGRPNPHVHWHVAPRFSSPIEIAGEGFVDAEFGWPLVWRERRMAPDGRRAVIAMLREAMNVAYA